MTEEKERKLVGITSPPFEDSSIEGKPFDIRLNKGGGPFKDYNYYGTSKGQIGLLKSGGTSNEELFDITQFHRCDEPLYWTGCYSSDKAFKKFIHQDTFAHPAKASMILMDRIFKHLKKLGLLKKGDVVCDFMTGTSRTGIMASLHGFDFVGIELEDHFIKMSEQNKEVLEKQIGRKVNWQLIQGDARKLTELLKEKNLVGITSPPFFQQGSEPNPNDKTIGIRGRIFARNLYGKSKGQISNLPDKKLVGITSPPFLEAPKENRITTNQAIKREGRIKANLESKYIYREKEFNSSNIGNLPDKTLVGITSPPYEETEPVNYQKENAGPIGINSRIKEKRKVINIPIPTKKTLVGITSPPFINSEHYSEKNAEKNFELLKDAEKLAVKEGRKYSLTSDEEIRKKVKGYPSNPSNIGNLKDKKLVGITSPPFEEMATGNVGGGIDWNKAHPNSKQEIINKSIRSLAHEYSSSQENLGNQQGESYLSAMLRVYSEAWKIMPILVTVTKNPTRRGKLRRLDIDTVRLILNCHRVWFCNCETNENYLNKDSRILNYENSIQQNEEMSNLQQENSQLGNQMPITQNKSWSQEATYRGSQSQNTSKESIAGIHSRSKGKTNNGFEKIQGDSSQKTQEELLFGLWNRNFIESQEMQKMLSECSWVQGNVKPEIQRENRMEQRKEIPTNDRHEQSNVERWNEQNDFGKKKSALAKNTNDNVSERQFYLSEMRDGSIYSSPQARMESKSKGNIKRCNNSMQKMPLSSRPRTNSSNNICSECGKFKVPEGHSIDEYGYKIIDYHRALLFTEEKQKTLVGTENKVLRGRLSFFKRLSIQKGNKAAMWEDVIIAVKE